jgi:hypothetical protein
MPGTGSFSEGLNRGFSDDSVTQFKDGVYGRALLSLKQVFLGGKI